jgi:hypothetical protein
MPASVMVMGNDELRMKTCRTKKGCQLWLERGYGKGRMIEDNISRS